MDTPDRTITATEVRDALDRLTRSPAIAQKPGLRDILTFVVEEELAGRGDRLKAYVIGVDALGRGESFDPSSDSIVRVQVNRLRAAIDAHYAGEGADDPVRIAIPKGSYRPAYARQAPLPGPEPAPAPVPEEPARRRALPVLGLAAGAALAGIAAFALWPDGEDRQRIDRVPVIDVAGFRTDAGPDMVPTVRGVREQLVVDLAHLGAVQVRDLDAVPPERRADLDAPDYALVGSTSLPGELPRLRLNLRAAGDGSVVWTRTLDMPRNDAEFYGLLREAVGGMAVELAGEQGVVAADVIRRLDLRLERLGNADTSEYECLLLAYAYDTTKDAETGRGARGCLSRLTGAGSVNSALWAEHALLSFLDAAGAEENEAAARMQAALAAARTAAQLDPYNAVAHEQLGSILSALARREEAIAAYARAVELAPAKPSLRVLVGWQMVLEGDWEGGMAELRGGVERSPFAPGWMRIPLAFDAFRREDYAASLDIARDVVQLGDARGEALAFGAAAAMGDRAEAARWLERMRAHEGFDAADPFRVLRRSYSNPSVMAAYERAARESGLL